MSAADISSRVAATANPKPRLVTSIREWGDFYVRPGVVGDIDEIGSLPDQKTRVAVGVAKSVCDADGNPIFDRNDPADMAVLMGLPNSLVSRLNSVLEEANVSSTEKAVDLGNGSPPATASSST